MHDFNGYKCINSVSEHFLQVGKTIYVSYLYIFFVYLLINIYIYIYSLIIIFIIK